MDVSIYNVVDASSARRKLGKCSTVVPDRQIGNRMEWLKTDLKKRNFLILEYVTVFKE